MNLGKDKALGFHFSKGRLGYRDGRVIKEGVTHEARAGRKPLKNIDGTPCNPGLHASASPWLAWCSRPTADSDYTTISYVLVTGITHLNYDKRKFVGKHRTYLKVIKITEEQRLRIVLLSNNGIEFEFDTYVKNLFAL